MSTPQVLDRTGRVSLGPELARGGEGAVYEVAGRPEMVAKIYHEEVSPTRAAKLEAMLALRNPALANLTAWPTDILRQSNGRTRGFLMPNLRNYKDIHTLYSPRSRLAEFPHADWRMIVRSAVNTAKAFAALHDTGCLVGDVNHGGIRVGADATVKLIDCDSFQINAGSRVFLCEVGVENFTPPELQGKSFKTVTRTPNHDNFGLAVMVFYLLMMGRHPFAGRFSGQGEMPIDRAIGEFRYAYGQARSASRMDPPPNTASVQVASPAVVALWEQAFGRGGSQGSGRPAAAQWVGALSAMESSFVRCGQHPSHYYLKGNGGCPWCPIERIGIALFGLPRTLTLTPRSGGPFNLDAIWSQIKGVPHPGLANPPSLPNTSLAPSAAAKAVGASRQLWQNLAMLGAAAVFIGGLFVAVKAWFGWGVGACIVYQLLARPAKTADVAAFERSANVAAQQVRQFEQRWDAEASATAFDRRLTELAALREEWRALATQRQQRYDKLVLDREKNAKKRFLERYEIDRATISGIGAAKKAMLESYGIETAADVSYNAVINVPGFGPALTKRVVQWRKGLEAKFVFNPRSDVDPKDVVDLDRTIALRRNDIEKKLSEGPASLTQLRTGILARRKALEEPLRAALHAAAQAKADLAAAS